MRRVNYIENFIHDIRYGLRMMAKNPAFTVIAIVTLGAGIGVNTTIFSFVNAFMLRRPPLADPERVMVLSPTNPNSFSEMDLASVSAPDFLDWRKQAASYSGMAAASFDNFTLSGSAEPERVAGARVSANYFQVLDVAPIQGRAFAPGEDRTGSAKVMILSEDLWRRRFGSDPAAIGRVLKVDGEDYTVIGVAPSRFRMWLFPADLWIPLDFKPEDLSPEGRRNRSLAVFARLKPGAGQPQAQAELAAIAQRLAIEQPDADKGWSARVVTLQKYMADASNTRPAMMFLTAAVAFVLLIACANLANLLLARNSARRREFAIRSALGAGRWRLARQLISECLLLSMAGAGLGLAATAVGLRLLRSQLNWSEYAVLLARDVSIDNSVLLFTLAVSVLAALFFGLAPALQLSRAGPAAGLKENSRTSGSSRERRRLQNVLVIGELSLSLILLAGAGLFVRSFIDELRVAPGFNTRNLLTASVSLSGAAYQDPARQSAFFESLLRQLQGIPEVESAAVSSDLPFTFPGRAHFAIEGRGAGPQDEKDWRQSWAGYFTVSPGYFRATQIPLLEGREFTPADHAGSAPVVIVNEAFARKFFPNQDPLGRHLSVNPEGAPAGAPRWPEIVGVAGNVDEFSGQTTWRPHIFEPFLASPSAGMKVIIRTRGDPAAFSAALRRAVFEVDKDQALTDVRTMERVIQDSGQGDDVMAELMGAFAGIALLMAAVGIYGLLGYLVGQRTQEFGVRMALGASRRQIVALVIRNAMVWVAAGTGLGFLISLALPRLFAASFTNFHVGSRLILAGGPVVVLLVALVSCYFPARRATRVDPLVALRYE